MRFTERQRTDLGSLDPQLRALSPQATLDRGYALVVDEAEKAGEAVPAQAHMSTSASRVGGSRSSM